MIKIIDETTLEIWDCDYYLDIYVLAGDANKNKVNKLVVVE